MQKNQVLQGTKKMTQAAQDMFNLSSLSKKLLINGNKISIVDRLKNSQVIYQYFLKEKGSGGRSIYAAAKIDEGVFVPFIKRTLE